MNLSNFLLVLPETCNIHAPLMVYLLRKIQAFPKYVRLLNQILPRYFQTAVLKVQIHM